MSKEKVSKHQYILLVGMFRITELCSILDTSVKFWTLLSESFFYYYYARLFVCSAKPFRGLKGSILQLR